MTNSLHSKCKRCGKEFSSTTCPYCTVTGLDLEALLAEEGLTLNPKLPEEDEVPVALVDTVTGKPLPVVAPVCKVGRDVTNDIVIAGDRSLSRYHFQIRVWGEEYFIEDCGSRNGTFLNGSPISTPRKLTNGDVVSAGMSRYTFALKSTTHHGAPESALDSLIAPTAAERDGDSDCETEAHPDLPAQLQAARQTTVPPQGPSTRETPAPAAVFAPGLTPAPSPITEPIGGRPGYPEWSKFFIPPEVSKLVEERERLASFIEKAQQDLRDLDGRISKGGLFSVDLLCDEGDALNARVREVFVALGWTVDWAAANHMEMTLKNNGKVEAVLRVVGCGKEPPMSELEALVNQQAVVWCQFTYEPKGVLVLQQSPALSPEQRPPLSRDFSENAAKKKLSVVTTPQLFTIYRLLSGGSGDRDYIKQLIMTTNGLVPGFTPVRDPLGS